MIPHKVVNVMPPIGWLGFGFDFGFGFAWLSKNK